VQITAFNVQHYFAVSCLITKITSAYPTYTGSLRRLVHKRSFEQTFWTIRNPSEYARSSLH